MGDKLLNMQILVYFFFTTISLDVIKCITSPSKSWLAQEIEVMEEVSDCMYCIS